MTSGATDLSEIADAIAQAVVDAAVELGPRIPPAPAAILGRWGDRPPAPVASTPGDPMFVGASLSPVREALAGIGTPTSDRLLGALELAVAGLRIPLSDETAARIARAVHGPTSEPADDGGFAVMTVTGSEQPSALSLPAQILDQMLPTAADVVVELVSALYDSAVVTEYMRSDSTSGAGSTVAGSMSAESVAAEHGRVHLAVAVCAAAVVLRVADRGSTEASGPEAIIGVAIGAAVLLIPRWPMPPGWHAVRDAERRATFLLPRSSRARLRPHRSRFALFETGEGTDPLPSAAPVPGNGLVSVIPGGVVVHTGADDVGVSVRIDVLAERPPRVDPAAWDEIVEVSYIAERGAASLVAASNTVWPPGDELTFPGPGPVRVRVHARDRGTGGPEQYELTIWESGAEPEAVLHRVPATPDPDTARARAVLLSTMAVPVIRTDFSDPTAWEAVRNTVETPSEEGWQANVQFVDDPAFDGADAATILALTTSTSTWTVDHAAMVVVDAITLASPAWPVLVVDLREQVGRELRATAGTVQAIENNLSIANMDFSDFARAVDDDGVFRGF